MRIPLLMDFMHTKVFGNEELYFHLFPWNCNVTVFVTCPHIPYIIPTISCTVVITAISIIDQVHLSYSVVNFINRLKFIN